MQGRVHEPRLLTAHPQHIYTSLPRRAVRSVTNPPLCQDISLQFSLPQFRLVYVHLLPEVHLGREIPVSPSGWFPHFGWAFLLETFSLGLGCMGMRSLPSHGKGGEASVLSTVAQTILCPPGPPPAPIFWLCGQEADCAGQDSPPVGKFQAGCLAPLSAALSLERAILSTYRQVPP